ncbi:hypothetical protein Pla52o_51400 [Novipirellula galeiformis]|uniref:HEAT repeat protein n=1 Tax=Novipirellula galeiformis TaxID=2528004 RepID=A0A5C6C2V5_9BACT|nr:hypothetical protein [Novipirellula galeiformis]TWU17584.1 hypothetical protein Pla52o_51400 [Novipirellula galeiformis]
MQGPLLTFATLAESRNAAALDLLLVAMEDPEERVRTCAVAALLQREEPQCAEAVLSRWNVFPPESYSLLRKHKAWITPAILESLRDQDANLVHAIGATETIGLHSAIVNLIPLAETHESDIVRDAASEAILQLAHELGHNARANRDKPSVRAPLITALAESTKRIAKHKNERLVDAFLVGSAWADAELRAFVSTSSEYCQLIGNRLATTQRAGIVELLAGFISRRKVPHSLLEILSNRTDDVFRDSLLRAIGDEPSVTVLKNLQELGMPKCCAEEETLMDAISANHRAAAVHIYNQSGADALVYLRTIVAALKRDGQGCTAAAVSGMMKCVVPEYEVWGPSAILIAADNQAAIAEDPTATLLANLIDLLDHRDPSLVRSVRRILAPLHAEAMLERLSGMPEADRRALGRIVMTIDTEAISRIRDGLRHPVLGKRLDAIAAADALAAVDLLSESFERISREDHQAARVLACQVMSRAESKNTLNLLKEMSGLPPCPVRDAAIKAIETRQAMDAL